MRIRIISTIILILASIALSRSANASNEEKISVFFCSWDSKGEISAQLAPCKLNQRMYFYAQWREQYPGTNYGSNRKLCYAPQFSQLFVKLDCNDVPARFGTATELVNLVSERPTTFSISKNNLNSNNQIQIVKKDNNGSRSNKNSKITPYNNKKNPDLIALEHLRKKGSISEEEYKLALNKISAQSSSKDNKAANEQVKKIQKNDVINKKEKKTYIYKNVSLFDLSYDPVVNLELLGIPNKSFKNILPKEILNTYSAGCGSSDCMGQHSAKEMSMRFKRSEKYNQKYPGSIFYAMAHFEVFYLKKLADNEKTIERINRDYPNHRYSDGLPIFNLIKLNRVRSKLRNSLGMTLLTPPEEAIKNFWIMGDFLEKNKINQTKPLKQTEDVQSRLDLLKKYRSSLSKIKKEVEKEKEDTLKSKLINFDLKIL